MESVEWWRLVLVLVLVLILILWVVLGSGGGGGAIGRVHGTIHTRLLDVVLLEEKVTPVQIIRINRGETFYVVVVVFVAVVVVVERPNSLEMSRRIAVAMGPVVK